MKCPHCGEDEDRVVDSRTSADGSVIRRRRECLKCYMRFTTYERIEETPLRVIKKSGERVRFERDRILNGMLRACEKLPVPLHAIEEAAARVEARCQSDYDREVPSSVIGTLVMEELKKLNQVAYVRFQLYREFATSQFLDELKPSSRRTAGRAKERRRELMASVRGGCTVARRRAAGGAGCAATVTIPSARGASRDRRRSGSGLPGGRGGRAVRARGPPRGETVGIWDLDTVDLVSSADGWSGAFIAPTRQARAALRILPRSREGSERLPNRARRRGATEWNRAASPRHCVFLARSPSKSPRCSRPRRRGDA
jgi:transcriptional repressor NrdR